MATALSQYFGILTMIDCSDEIVAIGFTALAIGFLIGAIVYHIWRHWD